jgi:energy-coupling factor transport system ATP-binding protein
MSLQPDCLIFDEATSMLDPEGRDRIYRIARDLWKSGLTVIWVTQRLQELLEAERVVVLENGCISYDGDARGLFYDSDIPERCQWNLPPVAKVGMWLKQRGVHASALPLSEEEAAELVCALNYQT